MSSCMLWGWYGLGLQDRMGMEDIDARLLGKREG